MNNTSRRHFVGVAGAGVAAAGAAVAVPSSAFAGETRTHAGSATESLVAHVEDPSSSTVTFFVGEREVVVHDRDLVVRLLNAAGR